MNREETKREIETQTLAISKATSVLESLKADLDRMKPELRHGDYGYYKSNSEPLAIMSREESKTLNIVRPHVTLYGIKPDGSYNIIGNIFDDLEAMKEDVTEFKAGIIKVKLVAGGVQLEDPAVGMQFTYETLDELITGLRQLQATIIRKQG